MSVSVSRCVRVITSVCVRIHFVAEYFSFAGQLAVSIADIYIVYPGHSRTIPSGYSKLLGGSSRLVSGI